DLYTFGKVIGGGMPIGAYAGRAEFMSRVAPSGPIYQAGTLSGNPVAMAAGLATLDLVTRDGFYESLGARTEALVTGLWDAAQASEVPLFTTCVGGMFGLFFTDAPCVTDFDGATACDIEAFKRFFHAMLERGVYLAPSAYEAGFVSTAHDEDLVAVTVAAAREAFEIVAQDA
ncbi:MAG: aminotransferase class III-fold pyridoxal phosphate-dependent enzyme, partial [Xanthomonadales bacterium]|nr:aminotransferase class III-fold pyridoxal phosphate-dependent enzyme [Xanthomonadales bacterium]